MVTIEEDDDEEFRRDSPLMKTNELTKKYSDFIEELRICALNSKIRYRMSAGLIYKKEIKSVCYNEMNINGNELQGKLISNHAEISSLCDFIKKYDYRTLKKYKIIVLRFNNSGELRSSFPCVKCMKEINRFSIKKIIYVDESNQLTEVKTTDLPEGAGNICRI